MRTVTIPHDAPVDRFRSTARVLTLRQFGGTPVPGERVLMRRAGVGVPGAAVPGFVYTVHYGDGTVVVDVDHQEIHRSR